MPHYQRLFQRNDGVRQWWKVGKPRIRTLVYTRMALQSLVKLRFSVNADTHIHLVLIVPSQTPRSPYMLYPYYVMLWGGFAG